MVDLYFPPSTGVSVIAEPGTFFVSSAFTLAVNIISKEVVARDCQDQAHGEWHDVNFLKMLGLIYRQEDTEKYDFFLPLLDGLCTVHFNWLSDIVQQTV